MIPRDVLNRLDPYVPGRSIAGGMKLSSNENPLGSSPLALAAIRDALTESSPLEAELNRYPDGAMTQLRRRLAEFWDVEEDMILVGNGSDEILVMIAGAFVEQGCNAITARHTFSQYTFATEIFGGSMRYTDMPEGRFDLDAIAGQVDGDTRLVFLCNPNNPTSTLITHGDLEQFLARTPEHVLVVVDEAYAEFADSEDFPRTLDLMNDWPNLVRLRTFSKIYGLAALRVGYVTGRAQVIGSIAKLRQPFNVGTIGQRAATAALNDSDWVTASVRNNAGGRKRLCEALESLGIPYYPPAGNFVCAHFPPDEPSLPAASDVVRGLAESGIAVRPLGSFGLPDHVRISVGTPAEVTAVCDALSAILRAVRPGATAR